MWLIGAGIAVVAAAVFALLLVVVLRERRGRREETRAQSPPVRNNPSRSPGISFTRREDAHDEITQPLPVTIRPRANTSSVVGFRAAARTDKGRVRSINEDDTLLAELTDDAGSVHTGLYAVADGVGGQDKGEVASKTAIEATIAALQAHPFFAEGLYRDDEIADDTVLDVLRDSVAGANRAVYSVKVEQRSDLATTLVLALVLRGKAYIANVGDSRAYLLRDDRFRQITEDHTAVERMVAMGQITVAEARQHPQRNVIFRSLGTYPQIEVDLFVEELEPGDRLLLCSDGLTGMIPDEALMHIARNEADLDKACRMMVRAANEAGGTDNISVVLAEVLETEPES